MARHLGGSHGLAPHIRDVAPARAIEANREGDATAGSAPKLIRVIRRPLAFIATGPVLDQPRPGHDARF
jgi:hypothetical protein